MVAYHLPLAWWWGKRHTVVFQQGGKLLAHVAVHAGGLFGILQHLPDLQYNGEPEFLAVYRRAFAKPAVCEEVVHAMAFGQLIPVLHGSVSGIEIIPARLP
jgi:hypothetical protein